MHWCNVQVRCSVPCFFCCWLATSYTPILPSEQCSPLKAYSLAIPPLPKDESRIAASCGVGFQAHPAARISVAGPVKVFGV